MSRAARNRLLFWVLLIGVVIVALFWALRPQPVLVDLAMVELGPVQVTVDEEGRTRVRDLYVVSTPVEGRVRRIEAEVGDHVLGGETVLASIEPSDPSFLDVRTRRQLENEIAAAHARLALARAEIDRVEAELYYARSDLSRAHRLVISDTVAAAVVEKRETEVRKLEASLVEAQAQLEVWRAELAAAESRLIEPSDVINSRSSATCCVAIRAPVDGRVLARLQESEAVVSAGTPLIEIGNPRDLEVVVDVLSRDAVRITEGDPVRIEGWGGDGAIAATVARIEPKAFTEISALGIEEQRVNIRIDFADPIENWGALGDGFRVEARIVVWQADAILRLPLAALFRHGEDWAVYVADEDRARLRLIDIAQRNDHHAVVIHGLEADERVVLYPDERIANGTRIKQRDAISER